MLSNIQTEVPSSLKYTPEAERPTPELQFRARPPGGSGAPPTAGSGAQSQEGALRPGVPLGAHPTEAGPVRGPRAAATWTARGCEGAGQPMGAEGPPHLRLPAVPPADAQELGTKIVAPAHAPEVS